MACLLVCCRAAVKCNTTVFDLAHQVFWKVAGGCGLLCLSMLLRLKPGCQTVTATVTIATVTVDIVTATLIFVTGQV